MGSVALDLVASSTLGCVVGQALSSPNPSLGGPWAPGHSLLAERMVWEHPVNGSLGNDCFLLV